MLVPSSNVRFLPTQKARPKVAMRHQGTEQQVAVLHQIPVVGDSGSQQQESMKTLFRT